MLNRRKFLKIVGAFGVAFLAPLDKLIDKLSLNLKKDSSPTGELYEGFVLLEKDAPAPFFVRGAPTPILGEVDPAEAEKPNVASYKGAASWFDNFESLSENVAFPLFVPSLLPDKMIFLQGYVLRFAGSAEVWEARSDYGFEDEREPLISLSARPIFAQPFPVWPVLTYPTKQMGQVILEEEYRVEMPKKVTFTPRPGIMLPSERGYMLQWIQENTLYTLFMEYEEWRGMIESVCKSLIEI